MSDDIIRERIVEKQGKEKKDFSEEYIHSLREEAAGWRRKYRELQVGSQSLEVKAELSKRGIKADPEWVAIGEGQSVDLAVEAFVNKYPHLVPESTMDRSEDPEDPISNIINRKVEIKKAPSPKMPDPASYGNETRSPQETLKNRQIDEIKKDPEARALLRKEYRSMLSSQGHRNSEY